MRNFEAASRSDGTGVAEGDSGNGEPMYAGGFEGCFFGCPCEQEGFGRLTCGDFSSRKEFPGDVSELGAWAFDVDSDGGKRADGEYYATGTVRHGYGTVAYAADEWRSIGGMRVDSLLAKDIGNERCYGRRFSPTALGTASVGRERCDVDTSECGGLNGGHRRAEAR